MKVKDILYTIIIIEYVIVLYNLLKDGHIALMLLFVISVAMAAFISFGDD